MPKRTTNRVETVVYKGITFRRYPNSPNWADKSYYHPDRRMLPQALKLSILRYGKMLTDLYQMDVRSTTRTVTLPTMLSKIWNVSHQRSMQSTMLRTSVKSVWKSCVNELTMPGLPLVRGTSQKLVGNGTRNWARWLGRTPSISQGSVTIARKNFKQLLLAMKSSTATNNCKSAARRKSGIDNETRTCGQCGKEFVCNKYARKQHCNSICAQRHRRGD